MYEVLVDLQRAAAALIEPQQVEKRTRSHNDAHFKV